MATPKRRALGQPEAARLMRSPLRWLAGLTSVLALGYTGLLLGLYVGQERLLFRPHVLPANHAFALPNVSERSIAVEGASLSALHFRQPAAKGIVFFLHGNSGSLANWMTSTDLYERTQFDLFMLDYRGFGKSTGSVESELQLHKDVRTAWDAIAAEYAGRKVIFFGRSMGTGLAAHLATQVNPDLLVLVSPYESIMAMASERFPLIPSVVLRYPLRTDLALAKVQATTLILHGSDDEFIRLKHAVALTLHQPKARLITIEGAGHNDIHTFAGYIAALENELLSLAAPSAVAMAQRKTAPSW
jgi:uncharacterized protein